jgi:hypothetical protein
MTQHSDWCGEYQALAESEDFNFDL